MSNSDRLSAALAGRYRIERELGAGGMATVYLAHDVRHDRKVAIKVLHPELAAALGGERFLAEIKTTAKLQHPHILPLLDSGEGDGLLYYVMPFATGETLRDRLSRERQLPIPDALAIAREVADALGAAHAVGIIHRDIKPENILIQGGHALVADFGIALAVQSAGGARMTQTGLSLGTPQYMSPEQAMGEKVIDARSDIYALGAVTYEMLVGEPPFSGASVQAIVAKVMSERPVAIRLLRDTVPPGLEAAVLAALAKLPADRPQSAAEFVTQLGSGAAPSASYVPPADRRAVRRWQAIAAAAVVIAGAATAWSVRTPPVTVDVVRFSLPWGSRATSSSFRPALSPDGRIVAFGDASGLHAGVQLRWLDRNDPVVIPGTEDAGALTFSPDGSAIAYVTSATGLYTVGLDGQHKTLLHATKATAFDGILWALDGYVYFMDISVIRRVKATGGEAEEVYHVPPGSVTGSGGGALRFPAILNDGRHLGFATRGSGPSDGSVSVLDMSTRTATRLAPGIAIVGEHDGWLLWALATGALVAQRIEYGGTPRLLGERVTLVDNIRVADSSPVVAFGRNGTLVYQSTTSEIARLAWVTRAGAEAEVDTALARPFIGLSLSPDGGRIAVAVTETGDRSTIWSYDIARKTFVRLTDPAEFSFRPQWTPDSRRVLFASEHGSKDHLRRIFAVDPERSDSMQVLITRRRHVQEISWPPTGKYVAFREGFDDGGTRRDIFAMQLGDTAVRPLAVTEADEQNPAVSPDGKWLAYSSDETGTPELYLTSFPEGGAKIRVSTSGGVSAIWSRTGKQLYYRDGRGQLLSVAIDASRSNPAGATQVLFDATRFLDVGNGQSFAVTPNDDRFLFIKVPAQTSMSVVVNWWVEAAAKLAAAKP